jgi:hypothetical protein
MKGAITLPVLAGFKKRGFAMRFPWLLCATVGLLTLGGEAFAQTVDYSYPPTPTIDVTFETAANTQVTVTNAYIGPISATVVGSGQGPFPVYCVDLENNVFSPTSVNIIGTLNVTNPTTTTYDPDIKGTYFELQQSAYLIANVDTTGGGNSTLAAQEGAGLQAAIWDIIDGQYALGDTNVGSNSNTFYIGTGTLATNAAYDQSIINDANADLLALTNAASAGTADGTLYQVNRNLMGANGQDMLTSNGGQGPHGSSTPEGASLLMFLPGLIPVAVGLRRRRNKAAGK